MPRCAIFNFSVLFLENRLATPIRSPNQRGFARNNTYHKEIIRQCGFCKSSFLYPWDYDKHLDATHVWCDDCHKFVKDRATFNKHYRKFHDRQQEKEDPQQQQPTPQPQSTGASAGAGTGISMGTGTATQATSAEIRQVQLCTLFFQF